MATDAVSSVTIDLPQAMTIGGQIPIGVLSALAARAGDDLVGPRPVELVTNLSIGLNQPVRAGTTSGDVSIDKDTGPDQGVRVDIASHGANGGATITIRSSREGTGS